MINFFCVNILYPNGKEKGKQYKTIQNKTKRRHEGNRDSQNHVVGSNCSDHLVYL